MKLCEGSRFSTCIFAGEHKIARTGALIHKDAGWVGLHKHGRTGESPAPRTRTFIPPLTKPSPNGTKQTTDGTRSHAIQKKQNFRQKYVRSMLRGVLENAVSSHRGHTERLQKRPSTNQAPPHKLENKQV